MSVHLTSAVWRMALEPAEKLILLAIADMANDEGHAWPSVRSLEARTGLSDRTIQRYLTALVDAGLVVRQERPGRSTVYQVLPDRDAAEAPAHRQSSPKQGRQGVTPDKVSPPTQCHPTPDTVSPRSIKDPLT